jgi:hypothetical protein
LARKGLPPLAQGFAKSENPEDGLFLKKGRFFLGKALFFPLLKQERNFEKTPAKANPFS